MLTNIKPLFAIAIMALLQSCVKDIPVHKILDDKLLLSKTSGQFQSALFTGTNAYEYDATGKFLNQFSYAKKTNNLVKHRSLQKISFINKGSWNFEYDNWLPTQVIDSAFYGLPPSAWLFSYDQKYQVKEIRINREALGLSNLHEYFTYNHKGQLTELINGASKTNPSFKITYQYDIHGKLKSFEFYLGYGNDGGADRKVSTGLRQQLILARQASARKNTSVYDLVFRATITSDNNKNPFSQQESLLFYTANRDNIYFNDFFIPLMSSNPLQVTYTFSELFGSATLLQNFQYTYNKQKYPVTITETQTDPGLWQFGDCRRSTTIDYIKND